MSVLAKSARILDLVAEFRRPPTLTSIAQRAWPATFVDPPAAVRAGRAWPAAPRRRQRLRARAAAGALGPGGGRASIRSSRSPSRRMIRLRDAIGESVHLYVRQRDRRVCVAAVDGNYELRHFTEVGKPLPLSVGASGKLLLAFAEPRRPASGASPRGGRAAHAARTEPRATERSARAQSRATGWSTSFGEREEGLAAAAVPIRNHAGDVVAALSVSGPTARLTAERFDDSAPELKEAAAEISADAWAGAPSPPLTARSAALAAAADLRGRRLQRRAHLGEARLRRGASSAPRRTGPPRRGRASRRSPSRQRKRPPRARRPTSPSDLVRIAASCSPQLLAGRVGQAIVGHLAARASSALLESRIRKRQQELARRRRRAAAGDGRAG